VPYDTRFHLEARENNEERAEKRSRIHLICHKTDLPGCSEPENRSRND
jgi:hypothetical protein